MHIKVTPANNYSHYSWFDSPTLHYICLEILTCLDIILLLRYFLYFFVATKNQIQILYYFNIVSFLFISSVSNMSIVPLFLFCVLFYIIRSVHHVGGCSMKILQIIGRHILNCNYLQLSLFGCRFREFFFGPRRLVFQYYKQRESSSSISVFSFCFSCHFGTNFSRSAINFMNHIPRILIFRFLCNFISRIVSYFLSVLDFTNFFFQIVRPRRFSVQFFAVSK